MAWSDKIRGAVREGIEEGAATIAGPFVPLLTELPALIGLVAGEVVEQLTPLRRAALLYELRYVEELCHEIYREYVELGGKHPAPANEERVARLLERLHALGDHAERIRADLWPVVYQVGEETGGG